MIATMTTMPPWNRTGREHEPARDRERPSHSGASQFLFRGIALSFFLIFVLLPPTLAANDPGHDTLYIEETGNSALAGDLNITQDLRVADLFYSSNLDIMGNGSQPGNSRAEIYATSGNALYINAPGNLYFGVTGSGSMVYLGASGVHLNVSGNIYSGNKLVCLADGTNCITGTNSGNVTSIIAGNGISVDQATGDVTISTSASTCNAGQYSYWSGSAWNCRDDETGSGADGTGGWTNTSTTTSTSLDVAANSGKITITGADPELVFDETDNVVWRYLVGGDQWIVQRDGADMYVVTDHTLYFKQEYMYNNEDTTVRIGAVADNSELIFQANATDRLYINADGDVGIGISDPSATLHVSGTFRTSGAATIGAASTVAGSSICTPANGLCNQSAASESAIEGYIYDNDNALGAQWTVTSGGTYDINFDSNSFVIDTSENRVGLGVASPSKRLEVSDGSKGITLDPDASVPAINTTSGNLSISSAGGYVIINLG